MVSPRTRNLPRPSVEVVAVELQVDQPAQDAALVVVDADAEVEQLALVLLGVAHAVDAADRRDDDGVATGEQRGRGAVAQPIDLVVDRRVLLDVGVAGRDVRLGLVVVVVADEVLDPVVGEELAHLLRQLRGQRLVRRQDQRRLLHVLDGPRDRGRLARTGDAEQRLEPVAARDTLGELLDRLRLVAGRLRSRRPPGTDSRGQSISEHVYAPEGSCPRNRTIRVGRTACARSGQVVRGSGC